MESQSEWKRPFVSGLETSLPPPPISNNLPGSFQVVRLRLAKVVLVDKVAAGVVRRVDVNHSHGAQIRLLDHLERLEIVALEKEVPRTVEIHAFLAARTQRLLDRRIRQRQRFPLARPVEPIPFLWSIHDLAAQLLTQQIEIDRQAQLLGRLVAHLGHATGEELANPRDAFLAIVGRAHFHPFHVHPFKCLGRAVLKRPLSLIHFRIQDHRSPSAVPL